jgi:flagellar basal body-associated protein FliL
MKDNHGFEKIGYVPPKQSDFSSKNVKKVKETIAIIAIILVFLVLAVVLFVYPGYFIKMFSETGYNFMN